MKTATLPALRVSPALREAAERALRPDETLSRFMEASLESFIAHRAAEDDFHARGLRSADAARASQRYVPADAVLARLADRLAATRAGKESITPAAAPTAARARKLATSGPTSRRASRRA